MPHGGRLVNKSMGREDLACTCGDFLVQRSDNVIAYQLAVTVDDANMGVTQVVRGCDLLSSTARQIYLQHLLGYKTPTYAHVPLLVDSNDRRLSKRDKDLDLGSFKAHGISAEQLIGFRCTSTSCAHHKPFFI